jgi:pyruvate formate lyase activating enzyme
MAFFSDQCIAAGRCVKNCPFGAIAMTENGPVTDWDVCRHTCYGKTEAPYPCTVQCYSKARRTIGRHMRPSEVMVEVLKDSGIYQESGGGVTVSGGEPLYQSAFLTELLRQAKDNWLHTAIETCGFASWKAYENVLEYVDLVFLDLKQIDSRLHERLTGQSNEVIFENASKIAKFMQAKGGRMITRLPVVPGRTDTLENIGAVADFVRTLPGVETLELMAYHRLGRGKYKDIGRPYPLEDVVPPTAAEMEPFLEAVSSRGLNTKW